MRARSGMKLSFDDPSTALISRKIRPSYQRIKVLEYLINNQYHPTVDQIYQDLLRDIPTLSKSTIYNTLNLFLKAGLIRVITIEDNETRYDILTEDHGHFKCEKCGDIYNFTVDPAACAATDLTDFKVMEKNVYFKGICPRCLFNINPREEKERNA